MFAQKLRHQTGVKVNAATSARTDDDADRFAFEINFVLRVGQTGPSRCQNDDHN